MKIKVLDCTLRDGGYVNNFSFGEENKIEISNKLVSSGIDIIELGFLMNGKYTSDQSLYNKVSEAENYIDKFSINQQFCLMIRPDWYDINLLERATEKINTLRFAFHASDIELTLNQAKKAKEFGYSVYLNPVNVTSYTESELSFLLDKMNDFKPDGVSIVDTFGSLLPKNFKRVLKIFHLELEKNITLGLHLHENLSLAMGLAYQFLDEMCNIRNVIIDSSLLGMGRIPGNLCTELITGWLNIEYDAKYDQKQIFNLLSSTIQPIREKFVWGYLPAYAKTGFEKVHRDYAEYMIEKTDFTIAQIFEVIEDLSVANIGNKFKESTAIDYIEKRRIK